MFVTGTSWSKQSAYDIATIAYRVSDGAQQWLKRYNGSGNGDDTGLSVAVSPSGKSVFVTGKSQGAKSADDYITIAYAAATGAWQWGTRYNGTSNGIDQAHALAVNPAGTTVYVTGHSEGRGSGADSTTIARIWLRFYDGPAKAPDGAMAAAASPKSGRVFVTGHSQGTGAGPDYATIAYTG